MLNACGAVEGRGTVAALDELTRKSIGSVNTTLVYQGAVLHLVISFGFESCFYVLPCRRALSIVGTVYNVFFLPGSAFLLLPRKTLRIGLRATARVGLVRPARSWPRGV